MRERVEGLGRALGPRDVGDHFPLRLRADAACRRRATRLLAQLHDLRRVGLAADVEALHGRAPRRPEALPAAGDSLSDLRRQEPADRRRAPTLRPRAASSRSVAAEVYALYEKRMLEANAMDFDDLLVRTVNALELLRGGARALAAHLPPRPRRRVPGHQPRPVPAAAAALSPSTAT